MRSLLMRRLALLLCLFPALSAALCAQETVPSHTTDSQGILEGPQTPGTPPAAKPLDPNDPSVMNDDTVLRMHAAGISDELIVKTIQTQPGVYKTGPDELIALKKAGLSDDVLTAMTNKARRQITNVAPAPVDFAPVNEIGVYYKDAHGQWQPMESERIHTKTSGWIKNTLSDGIIKQDNNGVVPGPESKLILHRPQQFLIYTPEGVDGTEYNILLFRLNGKDREFRVLTGGIFHSESGAKHDELPVVPKRIAPHTWVFTLDNSNAGGGEYGILPPGTGNIVNGGKIYTFAFVEDK